MMSLCFHATAIVGFLGMSLLPMAFAAGAGSGDVDLDHVILGIDDLDRGIERFTELTGVSPARGGEHPGRGTQNALVSLGEGRYLEILAPSPSASRAAADPRTQHAELTPVGWALHTRALDDLAKGLRAAGFRTEGPTPGSRRTPEGTLLAWRTLAAEGNGLGLAPFLIEWSEASAHPSTTSPDGCRLVSLALADREPTPLTRFFAAVGYAATVRAGSPPGMQLILACPRGEVRFSS
jgi:hypothetical protein